MNETTLDSRRHHDHVVEDAPYVERLLAVVQAQQEQITRLIELVERAERSRVRAGAAAAPDRAAAEAPVDWLRISGRERLLAWQQLAAFVEQIVCRFDLQYEVTPCWWMHSEVVEELTGLWMARRAAYRKGAGLHTAMPWLDALTRCRDRLRPVLASCRDGHVETSPDRAWMSDEDRAALLRAVSLDVEESAQGDASP